MSAGSARPQVVILSSIEWAATWQRHQVFAVQWAKAGYDVFFVENTGFRNIHWSDLARVRQKLSRLARGRASSESASLPAGLRVINPLVLPPTGVFRGLNRLLFVPRLAERLRAADLRPAALAVAYLPTVTTLQLLDLLKPSKVVYDCVDNFYGHPSAPRDLARTEGLLLARSALVVTTSSTLRADKADRHPRVIELHQGVAPEFFLEQPMRSSYRKLCYFGTLWSALDYAPIVALAEAGFDVTLIGPRKEPLPALPRSVRTEPPLPYDRLPEALRRFDALLLPYRLDSEYNRGVVPAKLYECLATGCPVIASPLPALEGMSEVLYFARSPEQWVSVASRLPGLDDERRRALRIERAAANAHAAVFSRLLAAVKEAPAPHAAGRQSSYN